MINDTTALLVLNDTTSPPTSPPLSSASSMPAVHWNEMLRCCQMTTYMTLTTLFLDDKWYDKVDNLYDNVVVK